MMTLRSSRVARRGVSACSMFMSILWAPCGAALGARRRRRHSLPPGIRIRGSLEISKYAGWISAADTWGPSEKACRARQVRSAEIPRRSRQGRVWQLADVLHFEQSDAIPGGGESGELRQLPVGLGVGFGIASLEHRDGEEPLQVLAQQIWIQGRCLDAEHGIDEGPVRLLIRAQGRLHVVEVDDPGSPPCPQRDPRQLIEAGRLRVPAHSPPASCDRDRSAR